MAPDDARAERFGRSFLASVQRHGRVYEMGMMTAYKLRSRALFSDVDKVPAMLRKGKLPLLWHRRRGCDDVKSIFRRAQDEEAKR